jgi:hypothetical protein
VNRGLFHRIVTLLLVLFCTLPALGQFTRDKSANKKVDEAINTHYFATEFQKAEDILLGTIQACGEKCSPQTLARAWMYVGVVRGSGKQDMAGAKEAFNTALALDPKVKLDQDISSPETKQAFANAGGSGGAATPVPPGGGDTGDSDLAAMAAAADSRPPAAKRRRSKADSRTGCWKLSTVRPIPTPTASSRSPKRSPTSSGPCRKIRSAPKCDKRLPPDRRSCSSTLRRRYRPASRHRSVHG